MARISGALCLVLLVFCMQEEPSEAIPFVVITKFVSIALQVYSSVEKISGFISCENGKIDSQIAAVQRDISNKLDYQNNNIENMKDNILATIDDKLKDKVAEKFDILYGHLKDIESNFRIFYNHITKETTMAKVELERFARDSTSIFKTALPRSVEYMHEALVDADYGKNESVISVIAKDSKAADTICIKGLSSQQLIYDLYSDIAKADAKALIVKLFSYDILKKLEKDNAYNIKKNQVKMQHLKRLATTFYHIKYYINIASREVWRCDPQTLQKGNNYEKLQEVFQGYFINKGDLTLINREHETFSFFKTVSNFISYKCHEIEDERIRCDSPICKDQQSNKVCVGHIRDCKFISNKVQVCNAPAYDDRRYVWAHLMGTNEYYADHSRYCPDTQGLQGSLVEHICYCNCESEKQEDLRYFSLREVTSDIDRQMVVTGVQFVVDNHVFHIRIQQGVLSKEGTIIGKVEWKQIQSVSEQDLLDQKVSRHIYKVISKPGQKHRSDEWTEWYANDLVYSVHYKQKKVFLDDFDDNSGKTIVTGLRFKQAGDALRLEVRMTPFDYGTGKLDVNAPNQWKFNSNGVKNRREVQLQAPDDPKLAQRSTVFSENNSYIQFRTTDLKKDVGQNTIPFIDLQPVFTVSDPLFPLAGVGLMHRHDQKTGGFLALKIHHFNFAPHIKLKVK